MRQLLTAKFSRLLSTLLTMVLLFSLAPSALAVAPPAPNPQSGALGVEGTVRGQAPTVAPTITVPADGQIFTDVPITIQGVCTTGLLVKLFKNGIFSGSAQCTNGSYSITADLFDGKNDLITRVYDALDQASPDSNTVSVTFAPAKVLPGNRVSLTSSYAKRGANPGDILSWPIVLSGGTGPYAISVDWNDGKTDLISQQFAGTFTATHTYAAPGVFNIVVKATDVNGGTAFLQLVGVANGALVQDNQSGTSNAANTKTVIVWWPLLLSIPMVLLAFWLGKRHELYVLRRRLEQGK